MTTMTQRAQHDILGNRFSAPRTRPTWRAGAEAPEGVTPSEGLRAAGLDYQYVDTPVGYTLPGGQFVESKKKVILREPTADDPEYREMGVVASGYQYLQNAEMAASLDALAARTGWTFDTANSLRGGKLVFMSLFMGKQSVFGDDYETYLVVSDGKAAGRALTIDVIPYRLVCANGLRAADAKASLLLKIPHTRAVGGEYDYWLRYIDQLHAAQAGTYSTLESFAQTKITDEQAKEMIARAYPLPKKGARLAASEKLAELPELSVEASEFMADRVAENLSMHDYLTTYALRRQDTAFQLYERFNAGKEHGLTVDAKKLPAKTLKKLANTPYAALQAVTELADWGGDTRDKTAASSTLFGSAAEIKRAAWAAAEDLSS